MVKPVVVYGSETWAVIERGMKRLGTWERKTLGTIYGPVVAQGIWRIVHQKLREILNPESQWNGADDLFGTSIPSNLT